MALNNWLFTASASVATLAMLTLPGAAKAEDPIGSYGGASVGINRADSEYTDISADGVFAITDNIQGRASIGQGVIILAPTYSVSAGKWRFAAGPGLQVARESNQVKNVIGSTQIDAVDEDGMVIVDERGQPRKTEEFQMEEVTVEETKTRLVGLVAAERAIGDYLVVNTTVTFSEDVSGSVGVGFRF